MSGVPGHFYSACIRGIMMRKNQCIPAFLAARFFASVYNKGMAIWRALPVDRLVFASQPSGMSSSAMLAAIYLI